MTQTSRDAGYWLRRRVRVWSGNADGDKVVLAEGVVLAYSAEPTIMVRDAQGRDSNWQVTLPIETLDEEVSTQELCQLIAAGDRQRTAQATEDELDGILRAAGIEHPLGLRGVRDLVTQRDGQRERAEEAEAELTELRALKARLEEKRDSLALDHSNGRLVDMLDEIAGDL